MNAQTFHSKRENESDFAFVKPTRLLKTLIAVLLVILMLISSNTIAKGNTGCEEISPVISKCPSSTSASTWYVTPSDLTTGDPDYGLVDADNIQAAIDLALSGDTIILKAGTFVFAKENEVDIAITTASGSFMFYGEFLKGPGWDPLYYAEPPNPILYYQSINLNKEGLTLTGEVDSSGQLLTKITTPLDIVSHGVDLWEGYNGFFLINAGRVNLRNLQIENFVGPIFAFSPGFDISGNRFINNGFFGYLGPDNELTYPNWPKTNSPIRSYFQNNQILETAQPPVLLGSEIVVQNNDFEYYNAGLTIYPWGEFNDADNVTRPEPFPINWDLGQNNLIEGNQFNCNIPWLYGVWIWNNGAGDLVNNQVINNVIENCIYGVMVADYQPDDKFNNSGSRITGNTFKNIGITAVDMWSYVDPDGVRDSIVSENKFENVGSFGWPFPGGIWLEEGVKSSRIFNNDYTESGLPGWGWGSGLIYLAPTTKGNYISEFLFPVGTSMCDQIIDDGSNSVVGYGVCQNNPDQAQHLQEVFTKPHGPWLP